GRHEGDKNQRCGAKSHCRVHDPRAGRDWAASPFRELHAPDQTSAAVSIPYPLSLQQFGALPSTSRKLVLGISRCFSAVGGGNEPVRTVESRVGDNGEDPERDSGSVCPVAQTILSVRTLNCL